MATSKSMFRPKAPAAGPVKDPLEGMRRAQMAFEALQRGDQVPVEARMPDRGGPPVPTKAGTKDGQEAAKPLVPGMIHSQPGKPPAAVVREARASRPGDDMRVVPQGSAFERLKMGQNRLGRSTAAQSRPAEAGADKEKAKALGKEVFTDIQRSARIAHARHLIESVGAYYKSTAAENEAEVARLSALDDDALHKATQSYEFANAHVLTMTDEKHAQKVARESSKELRDFYEKNGTTEDTVESERMAVEAAQAPQKRPGRR